MTSVDLLYSCLAFFASSALSTRECSNNIQLNLVVNRYGPKVILAMKTIIFHAILFDQNKRRCWQWWNLLKLGTNIISSTVNCTRNVIQCIAKRKTAIPYYTTILKARHRKGAYQISEASRTDTKVKFKILSKSGGN
ncbi:hypothetical protein AB6A40_004419 [Gnathostoma spinigerum]|uniref:Secreted protein n=1 Tax=Gnathostoma spinigerum TaxID=75299 RepID=A0ABD6EDJ4_9BILA